MQEPVTTFRGLTLDPFQRQAVAYIEQNYSVLVSAPTGTGKTLVADYTILKMHREGKRVIYTAPIKALSNQKFKEFKRLLGEEHVGILTGDVVVNPEASVLIMTTEIFRNLLHTDPERTTGVGYVIFDEIHYIDDPGRGSVWEESLIFLPPQMRFVGLSATIPNVDELAQWAADAHGTPVQVVRHLDRAVPLVHQLYERTSGFCTFQRLEKRYRRFATYGDITESGRVAVPVEPTTHLDLLEAIGTEFLPCLYFTFSRRRCENHAAELAATGRQYLSGVEQARVRAIIHDQLTRHRGSGAGRLRELEPMLLQGIGYHHAGLLPLVKDIVEELFQERLLYVLYCTETFAVGLNFPCKTVCFDAVTKWDGERFRALTNREYFQMAGRAGRRGIDEVGYSFIAVDFNFFNPNEFPSLKETDVEPLQSRFSVSYNTVLNLVTKYDDDEIQAILLRNFASHQLRAEKERINEQIRQLEQVKLAHMGCRLMDTASCPLQYRPKESRLQHLQHRMREAALSGRRSGKLVRKEAQALRDELASAERAVCAPQVVSNCQALAKHYRPIMARIERLQRRLRNLAPTNRYTEEFRAKRDLLSAMDYIRGHELTARGRFAAEINGQELLVTELFFQGVFHDWSMDQINALAVSIGYEPRKSEGRASQSVYDAGPVKRALHLIEHMEEVYVGPSTVVYNEHLATLAFRWSKGARFADLAGQSGIDEGDVVYAFRRGIDVLRQVRHAAREDKALAAKLSTCIERMDRDEVSILL